MKINIFEGARRIALLLACCAALITGLVAFNQESNFRASYSLAFPTASLARYNGACPSEGRKIYFDHQAVNSEFISVVICLMPMTFTNEKGDVSKLIPYRTDSEGVTWGATPYSSEVDSYIEKIKQRFTLSLQEEELFLSEADKAWRDQFFETMGYLLVGLAIFGALVWSIGWIVRGFLGIPRGMDKRPD